MARLVWQEDEIYLGDAVYGEFDGEFVWIRTNNGIRSSEKIALERETLENLIKFAKLVGVLS